MSENTPAESGSETTEETPNVLQEKRFHNPLNRNSGRLRYTGDVNSSDQSSQPDLEFTYEIVEVDGPEGHLLTLAQARALRRALEWAAAQDQRANQTNASGDGEEKPRAA